MAEPLTKHIPLRSRLRNEAVAVFDALDENIKLMYSTEQCQMCGAHLTIRQLNRVITTGAPAVCLKDYKKVQGDIEKLSTLFSQMRLF